MYRINARKTVKTTVLLTGRKGICLLRVGLSIDQLVRNLERAQKNLDGASELLKKNWNDEAFNNFCKLAHELFALVLGESNTKKALAYYDGEYVEMLAAITPFVEDVIAPKIGAVFSEVRRGKK